MGLGKGLSVKQVCRKIEISEQTYYRWRQRYGGMGPQATCVCGAVRGNIMAHQPPDAYSTEAKKCSLIFKIVI